ncbi:MAG TPA: hypothetical protein VGH32_01530, partial [Pirellulales bacterium]
MKRSSGRYFSHPLSVLSMRFSALRVGVITVLVLGPTAATALGQGIALPAAGPINQSMGGASVAAPIDGMGA